MTINRCSIKKDDRVKIIAGRDKDKIGKVLRIITKKNTAIVEEINIVKKHTKPSATNRQGGIIKTEAPIHLSNVMLMCNKCMANVRTRIKILEDGRKVRVCKKCNEVIDS